MRDPIIVRVEGLLRNPIVIIAAAGLLSAAAAVVLVLAFPLYKPFLSDPFWFPIIVMAVMLGLILTATAVCILAERKLAGYTQDRRGPNRVGFWGLLQPMADGLKLFLKEDIIPFNVDRPIFLLAPCLAMIVALVGFAIIPWAGDVHWPWMPEGQTVRTQVASLDIGVLYIIAIGSIGAYGAVLAGYASNNKYSFYGGIRGTAQMISYELPFGLALLCILLTTGTLRPEVIVDQQATSGVWYVFMHPIVFFIILVSSFAETNRLPFDLVEAEHELVGGFHTEYSSMKFGMFFLGEYAHMVTGSALMVALFFGGWHVWGLPGAENTAWWAMLIKLGVYLAKIAVFIGLFMVVRWTLPRFRFDQLMRVAWQSLVPIGIVLVVAMAVLATFNLHRNWLATLSVNVILLLVVLWVASRSKQPVTGRQSDLATLKVRPE